MMCASSCIESRISMLCDRAATSWWYFRWNKMFASWCCTSQLNVFLKISKRAIARLFPSLRLCFLTINMPDLRIDCSERYVIKNCLYLCSVHVQQLPQWRNCAVGGPRTLWLTGAHTWKSWECIAYSFQGIKQKF